MPDTYVYRVRDKAGKLVEGSNAGLELPVPVVPLGARSARIELAIKALGFGIDGEAEDRLATRFADCGKTVRFSETKTGPDVRFWINGSQRRLQHSPPQRLETHRPLMTLRRSRLESPSDFPSNGVPVPTDI